MTFVASYLKTKKKMGRGTEQQAVHSVGEGDRSGKKSGTRGKSGKKAPTDWNQKRKKEHRQEQKHL